MTVTQVLRGWLCAYLLKRAFAIGWVAMSPQTISLYGALAESFALDAEKDL